MSKSHCSFLLVACATLPAQVDNKIPRPASVLQADGIFNREGKGKYGWFINKENQST